MTYDSKQEIFPNSEPEIRVPEEPSPNQSQEESPTVETPQNIASYSPSTMVFDVNDLNSRSTIVKATHWSIAWSDLMMTMFVLFLSMFVYQMANQEFLKPDTPEILGGDTTEALRYEPSDGATFPFSPISPGHIPLIAAGTIKRVEQELSTIPAETSGVGEKIDPMGLSSKRVNTPPLPQPATDQRSEISTYPENILEPQPLTIDEFSSKQEEDFQEIFSLSQKVLTTKNLEKFAAIDLIPDKTMRIVLTGDLLFATGASELSTDARISLEQVTGFIQKTPYMINIVGHTDNIPMKSYKYASNWELSLARASTVTRFLIDELGMNPNQFVISGYAAYRPMVPNNTARNRARNRRVEIIISKRMPNPLPFDSKKLNQ